MFQVLSQKQPIFLGGGEVILEELSARAVNCLLAVVSLFQDQGNCEVDQNESQALLVAIVLEVVQTHLGQELVQRIAMECQSKSKVLLVELLFFVRCR